MLKELRKQHKMSQEQLASFLNVKQNTISNWENGKSDIDNESLFKLSKIFNCSIEELLGKKSSTTLSNIYSTSVILYDVIGKVSAGYNGQAVEEYTGEQEYIPTELLRGLPKEDYFVLEVKGDSMYPKLLDGDRVLVQRTDSVDSGSIAIVLYDGDEATIKKVVYENGCDWIDLIPLNSKYQPKRISGTDLEQCRILGKVVNLTRKI